MTGTGPCAGHQRAEALDEPLPALWGRAIAYGARNARCNSLPRGGGGLGWGRRRLSSTRCAAERTTPTPALPQLGGGRRAVRSLKRDCLALWWKGSPVA